MGSRSIGRKIDTGGKLEQLLVDYSRLGLVYGCYARPACQEGIRRILYVLRLPST